MGEAKRKQMRRKSDLKKILHDWSFPHSKWEHDLVEEIKSLPIVEVMRVPLEELRFARMKERQCHVNALWYVDNDPSKRTKMVTGWWPRMGKFLHHSVVEQNGKFLCLTPTPLDSGVSFPFIPDDKILWKDEGATRFAYRNGRQIGPGIREDAECTLAEIKYVQVRLEEGMSAIHAGDLENFRKE